MVSISLLKILKHSTEEQHPRLVYEVGRALLEFRRTEFNTYLRMIRDARAETYELIRVLTDCVVRCCRFYYPVYKSDSEEAMIERMEQHLNRIVNVISDYEAPNSPQ